MSGVHWFTLGIGIVLGWFVVPMVLGMFAKKNG